MNQVQNCITFLTIHTIRDTDISVPTPYADGYRNISARTAQLRSQCRHCTVGEIDVSAKTEQLGTEMSVLTLYSWPKRFQCKHCTVENRDYSAGTVQLGKQMSVLTLYSWGQRCQCQHCTVENTDASASTVQLGKKMSVPTLYSWGERCQD